MKHIIRTALYSFIVLSLVTGTGCKSSKKAAATKAKADREAKLAKDKAEAERKQKEEEERIRKEAEAKAKAQKNSDQQEIEDSFGQIATAGSTSEANQMIEAITEYFTSPDAPVLIIINKSGDIIDYDKPTTIKRYLEYLKDTKKNMNTIFKVSKDGKGKIKELILIKK